MISGKGLANLKSSGHFLENEETPQGEKQMKKFFNIAGPCHPDRHYMLPAQDRCKGIHRLIDQEQYFVIHAARQTGKTTLLLDLVRELDASEEYYALYCSLESVQGITDPKEGIPAIIRTIARNIRLSPVFGKFQFGDKSDAQDFNNALMESLSLFSAALDRPLVLFFDEADCLSNGTLISFLRQLRDGYVNRVMIPFVHSVGLIGMRNIRDYRAQIRDDRESLGSASPFNIVRKSLTLRNFTQEEIIALYSQHSAQTGQIFSSEVTDNIWHHTRGQPWLLNAVAAEISEEILGADTDAMILPKHADQAVQNIIFRRDTHIDSLLERLKEERVRRIVEPVIIGENTGFNETDDDYQYVLDIGLLEKADGVLRPSNPIYAEVMMRNLSSETQMAMDSAGYPPHAHAYVRDGRLDMRQLFTDFQQFWRENSEIWTERYQYKEAAPHLVLTAFLQRVINKGGQITREPALGRRRFDLCIHYGGIRYPVELKLRHKAKTYEEGKKQLADYMDKLGCGQGWLLVFDRRKSVSWKKKLFWKTCEWETATIHTVGC